MINKINKINFIYNGKLEFDNDIKSKVVHYWNKLQQETKLLKEGNILVVDNFITNGNDFEVELKETTFSNFMYAKENKIGDLRVMFSGAYILTADEYVVCVLNNYYENELKFEALNLVGGMADAEDIVNGEYSSQKCLKREFKEELGFDIEGDDWKIQLKYLKFPSKDENPLNYPIGTIYEIRTTYTKEQIQKMFDKQLHDKEVKSLVFFSKDNYEEISKYEHRKKYMSELWKYIFNNEN